MIPSLQTYVRQGRSALHRFLPDPRLRKVLRGSGCLLLGFILSAASLRQQPQPFVLGPVCALMGAPSVLTALGGLLGYRLLWGNPGIQPMVWTAAGLVCSLLLSGRRLDREAPFLMSSLCALIVSAAGVAFQLLWGDETGVAMYLLRVCLAAASPLLFRLAREKRDPIARWLWQGIGVLSLAQLGISWINLGFIAAGLLTASGAFPAAALAGLGLELSQITRVPMTAALCLGWLVRFLPRCPRKAVLLAPAAACTAVMALSGSWELLPLPGLLAGGLLAALRPGEQPLLRRRGEVGAAQVQLEMATLVMTQMQQLLLESPDAPVDEQALLRRCGELACTGCPERRECTVSAALEPELLRRCLTGDADLPPCKEPFRPLTQLRFTREHLRTLRANHARRAEYRAALAEQYRFLAAYLQELSDRLTRRGSVLRPRFRVQVRVSARAKQEDNGDRLAHFAAPECRYYVLLCDGMGTGMGAADAGKTAAVLLRRLLCAGFPPKHALASLNSLCALREMAGIVTVDLLEVRLDTGRAVLHKWGAAPSYLLSSRGMEKLGIPAPPPGLSALDCGEITLSFSLRPGDTLIMVSDGIGEDAVLRSGQGSRLSPGELARKILQDHAGLPQDDATAMTVCLVPAADRDAG